MGIGVFTIYYGLTRLSAARAYYSALAWSSPRWTGYLPILALHVCRECETLIPECRVV